MNRIREDGALVAIVDNDLLRSPWKVRDEIEVIHEHVIETSDPSDMTLASLLSATLQLHYVRHRLVRQGCWGAQETS